MTALEDLEEVVCLTDNDDDCVLESVTYNSKHEHIKANYDPIFKENPLFVKVIEKCFNLESSRGMSMVINETLLKFYKEADEDYIMSTEFETILNNTLIVLEKDPDYRFSHIKNLCEILRSKKFKKRVQLITLEKNITDKNVSRLSLKRKSSMEKRSKIQKTDIIDLDKIEDMPIINLVGDSEYIDNSQNDVVMINKSCTVVDGKENDSTKQNNECLTTSEDRLLVPQKILGSGVVPTIDLNKIKTIEMQIKTYKELISELDEKEVTEDSEHSPYLESERLKGKIVTLYKELCKLTGSKECKRREVRLKVIEGHPPGPVQNLQRFLNNNIGSNGYPPFPDFCDVVECVITANKTDNLGWSKQQIMNEASALFTHCGRALQKRRQKRDWRYILSKVKSEQVEVDPADNDPELQARLDANKRAAVKKEAELLEMYTMMQYLPPQWKSAKTGNIAAPCEASDNDSENTMNDADQILPDTNKVTPSNGELLNDNRNKVTSGNRELFNNNKITIEIDMLNEFVSNESYSVEYNKNANPLSNRIVESTNKSTSEEINNTATISNAVDINVESDIGNGVDIKVESDIENGVDINVESDIGNGVDINVESDIGNGVDINVESDIGNGADINVVKVKTEPTEDVVKLLEAFGDNYTVSVVDLNDPFFVIEISDSSDEE